MNTLTQEQGDRVIALLVEIRDLLKAGAVAPRVGGGSGSGHKEGVFTGWKAHRVPSWATYDAGIQFGDLGAKSLDYWLKWEPKGWKGAPPKPEDLALRKVLDEAQAEVESGAYVPPKYTNKPKEERSSSGSRPPRRETPVDQGPGGGNETPEEDVPF